MCISQVLTGDFSFCGRRRSCGGLCGRKCPPILNCFGEVGRRWRIGCSEIGNRARHFQHAVISPCQPAETFSGFAKQRFPGGVELADGVHLAPVQFPIRPCRSSCRSRASATRRATVALVSPIDALLPDNSAGDSAGNSIWMSMRSSSGPDNLRRYRVATSGVHRQRPFGSPRQPHGQGFITATN